MRRKYIEISGDVILGEAEVLEPKQGGDQHAKRCKKKNL